MHANLIPSGIPLAVMVLCLSLVSGTAAADWFKKTESIMGTQIHAEVWHENGIVAEQALAAVMSEMRRIDALMSPYKKTSELSLLNKNAHPSAYRVSSELFDLIKKSNRISELTHGAFDITYASVGRYYDYREAHRPADAQMEKALAAIDYRHLVFDNEKQAIRFAHESVYVDLGGIAKGYAVDRCINLLIDLGFSQAMVSAGGDSRIVGDHRGQPWSVGVKNPRDPQAMVAVLPLENTAISTSGDYERYFIEEGVRYHHILDPGTGQSAQSSRSVTILGEEATFTDALSTSVFVLGPAKGLALVNSLPGIDAIIIDGDGKLQFSDDLLQLED